MKNKLLTITLAILALVIGGGIWLFIAAVRTAGIAELNLHAYRAAYSIILDYLIDKKDFPHSWNDLENLGPREDGSMFRWPEDKGKIESRVHVNFSLLESATTQEMVERAITVDGPRYPTHEYASWLLEAMDEMRKKKMGQR